VKDLNKKFFVSMSQQAVSAVIIQNSARVPKFVTTQIKKLKNSRSVI
jgi:hypothetical protein